jgi:hypothetical protein
MAMKPDFDQELDRLQGQLPLRAARLLQSARRPSAVWTRVSAAGLLMVGGVFGFLPILGFWMLPLGLALLALDLPFLRPPLARLLSLVNRKLFPHVS